MAEPTKEDLLNYKLGTFESVPEISVAMAIRHMSIMLRTGISLQNTIKIMSEQAENPLLRKVFGSISASIELGTPLAVSMRRYPKVFSPIVVSIIEVGEHGGGLDQNLLFLSDYLKKKHILTKKIQGALMYPLIVLMLTAVEMLGVVFLVLPKIEVLFVLFKDVPGYVQFILDASKFIRTDWYWLLLGGLLTMLFSYLFLKTKRGQDFYGVLQLKLPIVKGVVKLQILTSTSRTIGVLMSNGIPLVKAIQITANTTSNSVYRRILTSMAESTDKGRPVAQSLLENKKYFPETFIRLIELGESSGSLEENLSYLHAFYTEELEEMTANMSALIEPLLLIFIGLMIGVLAISIIGPIYSLTSSIN